MPLADDDRYSTSLRGDNAVPVREDRLGELSPYLTMGQR